MFLKIIAMAILALPVYAKFDCPTDDTLFQHDKLTVMSREDGGHRIWEQADRHNLTYCISDNFKNLKPKMIEHFQVATADWMSVANVTFTYVPSEDGDCDYKNKNVTFRVRMQSSRRLRYSARAFFPYDDVKSRSVLFKKDYILRRPNDMLRVVRHELGHVLGFRHEHIRDENTVKCKEVSPFDPITDYDRDSIMHYQRCGGTGTAELSALDREGATKLYPFQ